MGLVYGNPQEVGMSPEKIKYVEGLAQTWIDQGVTPTMMACVARKGTIVFHKAYGQLTPEPDSPPAAVDSIFPMCSVSKPICATAAMTLVEDGLLSLNRPVQWYLPEFEGEGKDSVMVHHLLTHTSGMEDEVIGEYIDSQKDTFTCPPAEPGEDPHDHEWVHRGFKAPLKRESGVCMAYCNYGIQLVGEIIRRVSGKSLDQYYHDRLFGPLGMKDTFLIVPQDVRSRVVQYPKDAEDYPYLASPRHMDNQSAPGGVFSTVYDMAVFCSMILNKGIYNGVRILSPLSVDEMTRDQIPGLPAAYKNEYFKLGSWGLGWNIHGDKMDIESGPLESRPSFGHGGAGRSMMWIDPVYKVVGMIFYVKMPPWFKRPDDYFRNAIMSAIIEE
jgi:serine-type D-Ala-D-Ala carboxypeptidase